MCDTSDNLGVKFTIMKICKTWTKKILLSCLASNNKSLTELNLGNNGINHDGIIGITSVLNWNNSTLSNLNIDLCIFFDFLI